MKKIFTLLLAISLISCSKSSEDVARDLQTGCIYGINKNSLNRAFIACWPREIYNAGSNQNASNAAADRLGVQRVDASILTNYTNWEFIPNNDCNCN